ncbi:MAG: helix-turn-helix domain-containing protein [Clostridia bacterium]|nr:helix-turn-helix domain-containing protein [Clostridia bacterium]
MELKLGTTIKKLRSERGITQEELANKMGVSFQAVSKWETNTTTPDIAIIPQLALFFGVSIDSLFSMNKDDYMERISNMIRDEHTVSHDNFVWAERYLKGVICDEPQNNESRTLLVELYEHRVNRDTLNVGRLCEEGLLIDPCDMALHGNLIRVRNKRNETDRLINFYEALSNKYPKNDTVREKLIGIYINAGKYEIAKEYISSFFDNAMYELFLGDIEMQTGNNSTAMSMWETTVEKNGNDHRIIFEAAERFNKYGFSEKAISLYERSYEKAPSPKELDSVYARAFLFTKLGRKSEAISMWNLIIKSLSEDYGIRSGESVDWARREISKLSAV